MEALSRFWWHVLILEFIDIVVGQDSVEIGFVGSGSANNSFASDLINGDGFIKLYRRDFYHDCPKIQGTYDFRGTGAQTKKNKGCDC